MGLLPTFRSRDPQLPTYETLNSPTKERFNSDSDYYSSDEDYDSYRSEESRASSRNTSGSMSSGLLMLPKRKPLPPRRTAGIYPYRLPTKVTRWLCFAISGLLLLMILSLIRASQVENWKVQNGKANTRPPPPPVWEKFPFLRRYYGGIRTLVPFEDSRPEYPQTNEAMQMKPLADDVQDPPKTEAVQERDTTPKSKVWESYQERNEEEGIQECFIDAAGKVRVPQIRYYQGRPKGFPRNVAGSYKVLGLPEDICFERFGRYGPYGFGYSIRSGGLGTGEHGENQGSAAVWESTPRVDYRQVDWADVQQRCFQANEHRYDKVPDQTPSPHGFYIQNSAAIALHARDFNITESDNEDPQTTSAASPTPSKPAIVKSTHKDESKVPSAKKARTAVVVRCWDEYLFREDDIANVRSIITELALASGGRYDVHLLIQVKNDAAHPIWADHEIYQERIDAAIPEEFRGLVTLWTETQMLALYQGIYDLYSRGPELPVHGVYRGLTMAMQYFAYMHPEYEYFWQWEMDVRYTGHYYDFFTKLEEWAKEQPRKGLWERNSRFYFPNVHGSWEDFSQMARIQSEMGTVGSDNVWKNMPGAGEKSPKGGKGKTVWGAVRPDDDDDWFETANDPTPPGPPELDRYEWGVGEEADLITLNPIFDPEGTSWLLKDDITGFNRSQEPPPRRASLITTSRLSRRLLMTMHRMTSRKKQFAFPEMWPATVALQHGYKAVFAPHPVYIDRKWPLDYMAQTFNGGKDGSSGGSRTSVFGDREHNLHGLSWFYKSGFAPNVYRRWLGLKVNNDGGEEFETTEDKSKNGPGVGGMRGGEGRMCLPPMLMHPIKDVDQPIEAPPEEGDSEVISDPTA